MSSLDATNGAEAPQVSQKTAALYRMVMDQHLCPYGLKSKWLLERQGFDVEDHHLIGGYEALRERLTSYEKSSDKKTYTPVLMIFAISALMALAVSWGLLGDVLAVRTVELFAAFAMTALALQKLQDVERFSTMFLNYDLLAQRKVGYGYVYPFAEVVAGVLMIGGGAAALIGAPIALFIGTIGAISVYKAVYVDKRDLKCACVGGDSNVPLGFVSLTENLVMMAMGIWIPLKAFVF